MPEPIDMDPEQQKELKRLADKHHRRTIRLSEDEEHFGELLDEIDDKDDDEYDLGYDLGYK